MRILICHLHFSPWWQTVTAFCFPTYMLWQQISYYKQSKKTSFLLETVWFCPERYEFAPRSVSTLAVPQFGRWHFSIHCLTIIWNRFFFLLCFSVEFLLFSVQSFSRDPFRHVCLREIPLFDLTFHLLISHQDDSLLMMPIWLTKNMYHMEEIDGQCLW